MIGSCATLGTGVMLRRTPIRLVLIERVDAFAVMMLLLENHQIELFPQSSLIWPVPLLSYPF